MSIRVKLSTGEILVFQEVFDYAKFLVFQAPNYEYEVLGETPRLSLSPDLRKLASMAARLRANKERNKKREGNNG